MGVALYFGSKIHAVMLNRLLLLALVGLSPLLSYGQFNKPPTIEETKGRTKRDDPAKGPRPTKAEATPTESTNDDEIRGAGIGIGAGTNANVSLEIPNRFGSHMFRIGAAYQFAGQRGLWKQNRYASGGQIGQQPFFTVATLGYDYWLSSRFALGIQGSFGGNNYYVNYTDPSQINGGFHTIDYTELIGGFGLKAHVLVGGPFMLSVGYETLLGANATLTFVPFGRNAQ